jgi:hypothetical protein
MPPELLFPGLGLLIALGLPMAARRRLAALPAGVYPIVCVGLHKGGSLVLAVRGWLLVNRLRRARQTSGAQTRRYPWPFRHPRLPRIQPSSGG